MLPLSTGSLAPTRQTAVMLAAVLSIALANAWPALWTAVDDAFISARYAEHLATGHGWTWNAGAPAVEGFSNPLWTGWIAVGLWLGAPAHGWMVGWGLAGWLAGLPAAWGAARSLGATDRSALIAPLAIACSPLAAVAATNGLETGWLLAAVLWTTWGAASATGPRASAAVGLALGALAWLRPEGVLAGPIWLIARRMEGRPAAPMATGWAGAIAAVVGWRLWTFGALLPNTAGAKLGAHGWAWIAERNAAYLLRDGPIWPFVLGVLILAPLGAPRSRALVAVAAASAAWVAPALMVELWMPGGRLLLPALCGAAVLLAVRCREPSWSAAAAVAVALQLVPPLQQRARLPDANHSVLPDNGAAVAGRWLRAHAPQGATLAIRDAGVLAFYAGPGVRVHELHERALTRPHPDGRNLAHDAPPNPTVVVLTQSRLHATGVRYATDRAVFEGLSLPYTPLGRVHQHHHRFYDLYVRDDSGIPPLPPGIVVGDRPPR